MSSARRPAAASPPKPRDERAVEALDAALIEQQRPRAPSRTAARQQGDVAEVSNDQTYDDQGPAPAAEGARELAEGEQERRREHEPTTLRLTGEF